MTEMSENTKVFNEEEAERQINSLKAEIEKLKQSVSNACSDASKHKKESEDWKTKYRETLDEAERAKQEREEEFTSMQSQLDTYKANERIATYTAKLIESGFDVDTAKSMALSLPEGVGDEFFTSQKSFFENQKLKAKQESLNAQPTLSSGMPMSGKTAEQMEQEQIRKWFGLPPK